MEFYLVLLGIGLFSLATNEASAQITRDWQQMSRSTRDENELTGLFGKTKFDAERQQEADEDAMNTLRRIYATISKTLIGIGLTGLIFSIKWV